MPTTLPIPHRIFRPSYGLAMYLKIVEWQGPWFIGNIYTEDQGSMDLEIYF